MIYLRNILSVFFKCFKMLHDRAVAGNFSREEFSNLLHEENFFWEGGFLGFILKISRKLIVLGGLSPLKWSLKINLKRFNFRKIFKHFFHKINLSSEFLNCIFFLFNNFWNFLIYFILIKKFNLTTSTFANVINFFFAFSPIFFINAIKISRKNTQHTCYCLYKIKINKLPNTENPLKYKWKTFFTVGWKMNVMRWKLNKVG